LKKNNENNEKKSVLNPEIAYQITKMLSDPNNR